MPAKIPRTEIHTLSNADGPLEKRSGPQEIIPENRAVQKHAGGMISPDSMVEIG